MQVVAIEIDQVEGVVHDRNAFASRASRLAGLKSGALLHQAERRASLVIERDDLAVDDGALGFY